LNLQKGQLGINNNMKFTIFSGFYNNEKYIEQIKSAIVNQTHKDWEWLIADDFSDCSECVENALKKLEASHPNIKFVKPRWKFEFYFNPPVEYSTGEIMIVLDVDDLPHPKLLEIYNRHYEMYPEVEMVSCASQCRNNGINGKLAWTKVTNFNGLFNYDDATNDPEKHVWRSLGDARSYRIRTRRKNEFAFENEYLYTFCEDLIKTYNVELRGGKVLYLPRILYTYTQRSSSSISHRKYPFDVLKNQKLEREGLPKHIQGNFGEVNSIDHRYSIDNHEILNAIAFSDLSFASERHKLAIFTSNLSTDTINKINELYYDHKIVYNPPNTSDVDYLFFIITNDEDIKILREYFRDWGIKPTQKVIVRVRDEYNNEVSDVTGKYRWFSFRGFTNYFINLNPISPT